MNKSLLRKAPMIALWGLVALLALVRISLAGYEQPLSGLRGPERIEVPRGASLSYVAELLDEKGWVSSSRLLVLYGRLHGYQSQLKAGEYEVRPGTSLKALLEKIVRGDVIIYQVTLVEGLTFREYRRALENAENIQSTLTGLSDQQVMERLGEPKKHPEGLFFPDTYYYQKGESDVSILKRARAHMDSILLKEWGNRSEGLPYVSPYEALIMASIVEKESGSVAELEEIAGVFVRRMQTGMKLQTDPTVIYGLGEQYTGNLTKQHLLTPSPYNTYVITGLPPTPIANPGMGAIRAALHPAEGDTLYFVARGDGSHHFSATLEEHEKAVEEFQKKRRMDYRSSPAP